MTRIYILRHCPTTVSDSAAAFTRSTTATYFDS